MINKPFPCIPEELRDVIYFLDFCIALRTVYLLQYDLQHVTIHDNPS